MLANAGAGAADSDSFINAEGLSHQGKTQLQKPRVSAATLQTLALSPPHERLNRLLHEPYNLDLNDAKAVNLVLSTWTAELGATLNTRQHLCPRTRPRVCSSS